MGDKKKFLLRIDAGIFVSLEKWAADDLLGSVNAQIEFLLTDAVRKAGRRRTETGRRKRTAPNKRPIGQRRGGKHE